MADAFKIRKEAEATQGKQIKNSRSKTPAPIWCSRHSMERGGGGERNGESSWGRNSELI
jgi:hypothetical protein